MPTEKFMIFTDMKTNKENIVDMEQDKPLTLEEACKLLNEQNQDIKQLKILVESLKMDNKKLKGRLTDLGVEYY